MHWLADGHATPSQAVAASIVVGVGVPGAVGLNVTSLPGAIDGGALAGRRARHRVQEVAGSIVVGVGVPGAVGLNVTCRAPAGVDGGALARRRARHPVSRSPASIVVGVGVPGAVGLNVTSRPSLSTAVHWLADGHATPVRPPPVSIVVGVGLPGAVGLNVTSLPVVVDGGALARRRTRHPAQGMAAPLSSEIGGDHDSDAALATAWELANPADSITTPSKPKRATRTRTQDATSTVKTSLDNDHPDPTAPSR